MKRSQRWNTLQICPRECAFLHILLQLRYVQICFKMKIWTESHLPAGEGIQYRVQGTISGGHHQDGIFQNNLLVKRPFAGQSLVQYAEWQQRIVPPIRCPTEDEHDQDKDQCLNYLQSIVDSLIKSVFVYCVTSPCMCVGLSLYDKSFNFKT